MPAENKQLQGKSHQWKWEFLIVYFLVLPVLWIREIYFGDPTTNDTALGWHPSSISTTMWVLYTIFRGP